MPKIIDHDEYRTKLARNAAVYFSEHGYSGANMRQLAACLGLSKSALYHYFPSKQALFLACTDQVMPRQDDTAGSNEQNRDQRLLQLFDDMSQNFGAEMALVFDYLRGKNAAAIAKDETMCSAMAAYRAKVAGIVGKDATDDTLALILGRLLIAYFSGEPNPKPGPLLLRVPTTKED